MLHTSQLASETDRSEEDYNSFEPPTHIGTLYRDTWNPDQGVLHYHLLGTGTKYKLLTDGAYNLFWVQREDFRSRVGGHAQNKVTTVYPEEPDNEWESPDGVPAESVWEAAQKMVQWLQEHVAGFEVPIEVNGWVKVSDAVGIEYRNPGNTALLTIETHLDETYSAQVQGDVTGTKTLVSHVESRADAMDGLQAFMERTDPDGYGLPADLDLGSSYGEFERQPAKFRDLGRWEHPKGFRMYLKEPACENPDAYTIHTSTGFQITSIDPDDIPLVLTKLSDHLETSMNEPFETEYGHVTPTDQ